MGPFHIKDSPELPMAQTWAPDSREHLASFSHNSQSQRETIAGAKLDVWQADADGMYESQLGATEPFVARYFPHGSRW